MGSSGNESWSIDLFKEDFKFSCAHFLIFPDGSKERLHGHNYQVSVEISGDLSDRGLVIDFIEAKPVVRELCDELDEHWIVPAEHPGLKIERLGDGHTAVSYGSARYLAPSEEVIELPINNTSVENLAMWFGREDPPQCLVHGDFRLDNMLFDIKDGAEPIAVLDWQTVATGKPMTDVGYFLGCGVGEAIWRDHETELLDLWRREMKARDVCLTHEEVERDYRLGILHGVSTAVFSAAFVERTDRGDANFLSMARGACSLARHRNSISALKKVL